MEAPNPLPGDCLVQVTATAPDGNTTFLSIQCLGPSRDFFLESQLRSYRDKGYTVEVTGVRLSEKKVYPLEEIYDKKVAPLITEVIEICKEHNIPSVMVFQLDPEAELHCTTFLVSQDSSPALKEMVRAYRVANR
jgi:hypothetical protein